MPLSNSIYSYEDIRAVLDKALESKHGVRLARASHGEAIHFRHKAYHFRKLDRKASQQIYPEGDPLHGTSVYDPLVVQVVDNNVVIKRTNTEELLSQLEEL